MAEIPAIISPEAYGEMKDKVRRKRAELEQSGQGDAPLGIHIPYQYFLSVTPQMLGDPNAAATQTLYARVIQALKHLESKPYGQQLFADILNNRSLRQPTQVATHTTLAALGVTDDHIKVFGVNHETIAQYLPIPGKNTLVLDPPEILTLNSSQLKLWGYEFLEIALLHEGDHIARAQSRINPRPDDPSSYYDQLVSAAFLEKSAVAREEHGRQDRSLVGDKRFERRLYFYPELYMKDMVKALPDRLLADFATGTQTFEQWKQHNLATLQRMAVYNHIFQTNDPSSYSLEQAETQAREWADQLRTRAQEELSHRQEHTPTRQKRGDTMIPGLPKLNVALADEQTGTDTGLPAHLRTQPPRTLV